MSVRRSSYVSTFALALAAAACDEGPPPPEITLDDDGATLGVVTAALDEGTGTFSQPLGIRNGGPCDLAYTATISVATGDGWLAFAPQSGTIAGHSRLADAAFEFTIDGLAPGLDTGSLVVGTTSAICQNSASKVTAFVNQK